MKKKSYYYKNKKNKIIKKKSFTKQNNLNFEFDLHISTCWGQDKWTLQNKSLQNLLEKLRMNFKYYDLKLWFLNGLAIYYINVKCRMRIIFIFLNNKVKNDNKRRQKSSN